MSKAAITTQQEAEKETRKRIIAGQAMKGEGVLTLELVLADPVGAPPTFVLPPLMA